MQLLLERLERIEKKQQWTQQLNEASARVELSTGEASFVKAPFTPGGGDTKTMDFGKIFMRQGILLGNFLCDRV